MKEKSMTIANISPFYPLWNKLPYREPYTPNSQRQKPEEITDFLKNVHSSWKSQHELTDSQIISIRDFNYNENFSKEAYLEQKKYFFSLLFKATKEIHKQILQQVIDLKKIMDQNILSLNFFIIQVLSDKNHQIKALQLEVNSLKVNYNTLFEENRSLKNQLEKYENQNSKQLAETNSQLRVYLKNMNDIMMSYHAKNMELERQIKQMSRKHETTFDSEMSVYKSSINYKNFEYSQIFHNHQSPNTRESINFVNKNDQQQSYSPILADSPKSHTKKRFHRKNNSQNTCLQTEKYRQFCPIKQKMFISTQYPIKTTSTTLSRAIQHNDHI